MYEVLEVLEVTELEDYAILSGVPLERQDLGAVNPCERCRDRGILSEAYFLAMVDCLLFDPPFNIRSYRVCNSCLEGLAYKKQNQKERKVFQVNPGNKSIEQMRAACNVYTAACFTALCEDSLVPTTYTLQCVLNDEVSPEQQAIVDAANTLAQQYRWFHWAAEFRPIMERNGLISQ